MNKQNKSREPNLNWKRTGKTIQELSVNGKGTITLAEEKAGNRKRLVATTYTSIIKIEKED